MHGTGALMAARCDGPGAAALHHVHCTSALMPSLIQAWQLLPPCLTGGTCGRHPSQRASGPWRWLPRGTLVLGRRCCYRTVRLAMICCGALHLWRPRDSDAGAELLLACGELASLLAAIFVQHLCAGGVAEGRRMLHLPPCLPPHMHMRFQRNHTTAPQWLFLAPPTSCRRAWQRRLFAALWLCAAPQPARRRHAVHGCESDAA